MRIRFHTDLDGDPHIHGHAVSEAEVIDVLTFPLEVTRSRDESVMAIGRTRAGRILTVLYTDARDGDGIFVITAYDLPAKQVRALNKRLKRRRRP